MEIHWLLCLLVIRYSYSRAFGVFFTTKIPLCTPFATCDKSGSTIQIPSIPVGHKPECLWLVRVKMSLKALLAMMHVTVLNNLCHFGLPLNWPQQELKHARIWNLQLQRVCLASIIGEINFYILISLPFVQIAQKLFTSCSPNYVTRDHAFCRK